jgi:hypothetical protein
MPEAHPILRCLKAISTCTIYLANCAGALDVHFKGLKASSLTRKLNGWSLSPALPPQQGSGT